MDVDNPGGDGGLPPRDAFSPDVSQMPDRPTRNPGHRRAQSEILSLPDDLSFDSDLGVVGADGPSFSDEDLLSVYLDMDKFSSGTSSLDLSSMNEGDEALPLAMMSSGMQAESSSRPRIRHQHSQSMDGSVSIKPEMLASGSDGAPSLAETKKALSAAKLADLALIDPKRAKRIWANRQSAARSKERKMRYIAELERKVRALQMETTRLTAQLAMVQNDTNGLTAENSELKLRLQNMEQQVHLQDALNDALRDEVQRLKLVTGQGNFPHGGPLMSYGPPSFGNNQHYYHHNHAMQSLLTANQLQQLQSHSQHQLQLHPYQQQQQQQQQQLQQPAADIKLKGAMTSQIRRDSMSDNSSAPTER